MQVLKITLLSSTVLLGLSFLTFVSCSSMGKRPNEQAINKYKNSRNYDSEKKIFVNRRPQILEEMRKRVMTFSTIKDWLAGGENRVPENQLPEIKPNLDEFLKDPKELKTIWLGHSTFLLHINGKVVLVDPVLSKAASPVSFMVNRFQDPILSLEELPKVDFIVISHDHYDHLDMESIEFFKDKDVKIITPLGVGSHIKSWGISSNKIIEKDWWEEIELDGVRFIAAPSQHFSGRNGVHENETLWASWVIQGAGHNVYFSGDSGYDTHFKEIGEKYGPFDIAYIESGQYNEKWKEVHLLPHESIKAYEDLNAKVFFPIHWGMFELSLHSWYEPAELLYQHSLRNKEFNLMTPLIGEIVNVKKDQKNFPWWKVNKKEIAKN